MMCRRWRHCLSGTIKTVLLTLQLFQVLVLALHDWVRLGSLNDLEAGQSVDPLRKRLLATLVNTLPFATRRVGSQPLTCARAILARSCCSAG